ncbi:MAG: D-alanine--D-serine ligase VanG [Firmicutes bacterium]|nr:D-alanine--D-serine ligase VanG [Bacillota bacterium]MDD7284539.1 D-alanine--D-serine ligase VanG [Bacillota bacterium]
MKKKTIAVLFGGCSSEYGISLNSGYAVLANMDREKYQPIAIGITKDGRWLRYDGDLEKIRTDLWHKDESQCTPAYILPDRDIHGMMEIRGGAPVYTRLDGVFPVLHGKNGEDGTVQGLIELAGIDLMGCGTLSSALCMDKYRAHVVADEAGIAVPKACNISSKSSQEDIFKSTSALTYPLFVKPVKAGSSYGITVIEDSSQLMDAVNLALDYDDEVIIEEKIDGFEVGCSIIGDGKGNEIVGRVDEIELFTGCFFDYTRKYTGVDSKIHTPARIDAETEERIKEAGRVLFRALGCKGFARLDMFLTPEGRIVFNEVNTIPGFTSVSRFPKMMAGVGLEYKDVIDKIIEYSSTEE